MINKIGVVLICLLSLFSLPNSYSDFTSPSIIKNKEVFALVNTDLPLAPKVKTETYPYLQAQNYILIDVLTNKTIFFKNLHERIYPASITKLITALTALNIYPLDEEITVSQPYTEGKIMELKIGEKMSVKSLVQSLLVYSANDAAFNLASHHQNGVSGFVKEMNALIEKYKIKNTHFTNFDGIHNPDHFSTVYDLSQIGRLAIKNSIILDIVKNKNIVVSDISGNIKHDLLSTNELIGKVPEIEGLKTGWTPEAGGCFIALFTVNGRQFISVVAQSPDRFADTQKIVNWVKTNLYW